jgi:hypothetical protein
MFLGRLAAIIGQYIIRGPVREAAQEVVKKFGMSAATKGFQTLSKDLYKYGTKDEIVNAIRNAISSGAKTGIDDTVFSKSNAKKLSDIFNGSIDFVENKTKQAIIRSYANLNNKRLADTLKTLSSPGNAKAGKEGIDVLGIEVGGNFIQGKVRSKAYTKARDAALEGLRLTVVPRTKAEAFAVAYARGFIGEATGTAVNSLLVAAPRAVLGAPKARAFFRTLQTEVEFLRSTGQIKSASRLSKAIKDATGSARDVYGSQKGLISPQVAGYVSGRLTIPVATTYVFVDGDERKKNIEKFQSSIQPWAQKEIKTWVDSYTRQDGIKVKGHYRQITVSR